MTFEEAARIAARAQVPELWLTHYSPALGHPEQYLDDVRRFFPSTQPGKDRKSREFEFEGGWKMKMDKDIADSGD